MKKPRIERSDPSRAYVAPEDDALLPSKLADQAQVRGKPEVKPAGALWVAPSGFEGQSAESVGRGTPKYASPQGDFAEASPAAQEALTRTYLRSKAAGLTELVHEDVRRVTESDLAVDLNRLDQAQTNELLALGTEAAKSFYYFTSGAGLWSRGGGQVKATIPLNLSELVSPQEMRRLAEASDLVNAKSPSDVLFIYNGQRAKAGEQELSVGERESIDEVADRLVRQAKDTIEEILAPARRDPRSLPPLAMKFIEVALLSKASSTYVPFDVWTSEQTHGVIRDYVADFKATFASKQFDPDPKVQAAIVAALRAYFEVAEATGDTHLFGMQRGHHALHPDTGAPLPNTPTIGEGAGRAKAYLDETGRTEELLARGKLTWVFENIEVLSDLRLQLGAHAKANKAVSVILVPQRNGYTGGNPYIIPGPNGRPNMELLEQSAIPSEYAQGNSFFNSNTIYQPLVADPPEGLGFEVKNNGREVRVKQNAGDITHMLPTAGIGGRIGIDYENFKTYPEFTLHGLALIERYREIWRREIAAGSEVASRATGVSWG